MLSATTRARRQRQRLHLLSQELHKFRLEIEVHCAGRLQRHLPCQTSPAELHDALSLRPRTTATTTTPSLHRLHHRMSSSLRAAPQQHISSAASATTSPRQLAAATSPLPARNMPSPRSSPAMRPTSPLSPGYKTSHFDSLQPPQQRPMHSRSNSNQRRPPQTSLKLPSLPRFHPANFPSSHSSLQSTPDGLSSPQPPVSPRAHQRMYSDAQKHLFFHQREMLSAAVRGSSPSQAGKPVSPRLHPMGSPGPVTPLELEGEGYLFAGARSTAKDSTAPEELVEKLIREESRRSRNTTQTASR